jgi:hypothetical protein
MQATGSISRGDSALSAKSGRFRLKEDPRVAGAMGGMAQNAGRFVAMARLLLAPDGAVDVSSVRLQRNRLKDEFYEARNTARAAFHTVSLTGLVLRLTGRENPVSEAREIYDEARQEWIQTLTLVQKAFREVVEVLEPLETSCGSRCETDPASPPDELCLIRDRVLADLRELADWMYSSFGPVQSVGEVLDCSQETDGHDRSVFHFRRPTARAYRHAQPLLREIGRIDLRLESAADPVRPTAVARNPDGVLFVSLRFRNQVAMLDAEGQITAVIGKPGKRAGEFSGPAGLAIDMAQRLWITEVGNHRIQIFDPPYHRPARELDEATIGKPLKWPWSLCAGRQGGVFLADPLANRICEISADGRVGFLCEATGHRIGEFRSPNFLCRNPSGETGSIWIVDKGNHRLQLLENGKVVRTIGGCGLRPEELVYPISVAAFCDGVLAVSQGRWSSSIKLIFSAGKEQHDVSIDYVAGGMLAVEDQLFVAELHGNHIRVYERSSSLG